MMFHAATAYGAKHASRLYERLYDGAYALFMLRTPAKDYASAAIMIEEAGFQVRDCVLVLRGDTQWQAVLCKKPHKGTIVDSVLANGTGGMNIGKSRITFHNPQDIEQYDFDRRGSTERTRKKVGEQSTGKDILDGGWKVQAAVSELPSGRFPANLILMHSWDCEQRGIRQIKAIKGGRIGKKPKDTDTVYSGGWKTGVKGDPGYGNADGLETIENWVCGEDCPVKRLDAQAPAVGNLYKATRKIDTSGGTGNSWVGGARLAGSDNGAFDGTGGASRFYKQVSSVDALWSYLTNLITPPQGLVLDYRRVDDP
jgi:hypothetical protein